MSTQLAALLLTGGASRRMGFDKATIAVGTETCASRIARLLRATADPVLEVGPGWTGLSSTREEPPGSGPLAAVAAGRAALLGRGHDGPALVLACDLPLLSAGLLELLASRPGSGSVLPVVDGRAQPLCARWSALDLDEAARLLATGERSLRHLPCRAGAELLDEHIWASVTRASAFEDLDTPADLERLGLTR